MAEDKQSTSGVVPGLVEEFIAQLRGITEEVEGLDSVRASRRRPARFRCPVLCRRRS